MPEALEIQIMRVQTALMTRPLDQVYALRCSRETGTTITVSWALFEDVCKGACIEPFSMGAVSWARCHVNGITWEAVVP